jgi:MFS family permease
MRALHRRTFASLRMHRNYRLFFSGQIISVTGTWMQNIATAWLILELTHSPVAVGVLALCQFLPFSIFGLVAGVLVDRLDVRRLVIGTQAASMIQAAALAALALLGAATVWEVYLLAALRGMVLVLDAPARQALTFQMVGPDELPNAVALNSSLFNAARVAGPAAGGLVIALAGVGFCFAANAVSFLAVLAMLLAMRVGEMYPHGHADEPPTIVRGTREVFRYLRESRRSALVLAIVAVVSTFAFNFNVLLPVLARLTLHSGPSTFGVITACFGAGALGGALLSASLGRASFAVLLAGTAGFGLSELLLAPVTSVPVAGALLFLTGASFTLWTSNSNSILQLAAPGHLRGRIVGLYYYAFNGAAPLGGLLVGWLSSVGGTEAAFALGGGSALAMTVFAAYAARLRPFSLRKTKPLLPLDRGVTELAD